MIVSPGEKLSSVYLDRFQPAENVVYRLSVLDVRAIATESHFVDVPSRNVKGVYQCIQGVCCQAFGRRRQTYNVLIYVYRDPTRSTEGEIQVWQMTAPQWKKFSDLAVQVNLAEYDLTLTASKRGLGMDLAYSVVPDVKMRQYWSADQAQQLHMAVESFYKMGEDSLVQPMALNDWNQLLYDCGYDLQNGMWPGGQSPMHTGAARSAIGRAMGGAVLPPVPAMGGLPPGFTPQSPAPAPTSYQYQVMGQNTVQARSVPQGQVGGTVMQPPQVPAGVVPPSVTVQNNVIPVGGGLPQAASVTGTGLAFPSVPANLPMPGAVPPPMGIPSSQGVPLGTAPVVPGVQAVESPQLGAIGAAQQNEIPGTIEMSAEEFNSMLL